MPEKGSPDVRGRRKNLMFPGRTGKPFSGEAPRKGEHRAGRCNASRVAVYVPRLGCGVRYGSYPLREGIARPYGREQG